MFYYFSRDRLIVIKSFSFFFSFFLFVAIFLYADCKQNILLVMFHGQIVVKTFLLTFRKFTVIKIFH